MELLINSIIATLLCIIGFFVVRLIKSHDELKIQVTEMWTEIKLINQGEKFKHDFCEEKHLILDQRVHNLETK